MFVVDQYNPDGTFDEHKVMLGFNSMEEARSAYLSEVKRVGRMGAELSWPESRRTVFRSGWIAVTERPNHLRIT